MASSPVDRIAAMLASDAPERRIAAALVLGELRAKGPSVVRALVAVLGEDVPALQRAAVDALARAGAAAKVARDILPLCRARDAAVREAAVVALSEAGAPIVPLVENELARADAEGRRALETLLARLGGKEAFGALLVGLEHAGEDEANAAAVAMRQRAREADPKERRSYFAELEKLLAAQAKRRRADVNVPAVRAALKILGYLEDERAVPRLLKHATDKKAPASVRQEALIALRFCRHEAKPDAKLLGALVAAAEDPDRTLAQTALMTLAAVPLPPRAAERLQPLLGHAEIDRARFVIDMLAHRKDAEAVETLVGVVCAQELRRAEHAARALEGRKDAAPALAQALAASDDPERARLLRRALHPVIGELSAAQRKRLVDAAVARLASGKRGWEPVLDTAREAAPDKTAAALRALYEKLRRGHKDDEATRVLRLLCYGDHAAPEDRYALASRLLAGGRSDTQPSARGGDEALRLVERLVRDGYDVLAALRRDRSLDLGELYYVGFHFIEQEHPLGEELLREVMQRAGKTKLGRMARNKLELAGVAA
jgi:HEAT repeat protein